MQRQNATNSPISEYAVFTIKDVLNLDDVFIKLGEFFSTTKENAWWDLRNITKTDFSATSIYVLSNFIKDHQHSYPKGWVVIVANTELSYLISKTTLLLLRLDGFKGHAQLFRSRNTALKWIELAAFLGRRKP
jgi:hypothetical protein